MSTDRKPLPLPLRVFRWVCTGIAVLWTLAALIVLVFAGLVGVWEREFILDYVALVVFVTIVMWTPSMLFSIG